MTEAIDSSGFPAFSGVLVASSSSMFDSPWDHFLLRRGSEHLDRADRFLNLGAGVSEATARRILRSTHVEFLNG
jgi:hypothetical protein